MTDKTAAQEASDLLVWATADGFSDDFGFGISEGKLIAERYGDEGEVIARSVLTITEEALPNA